jgi:hypothetical protein
MKRANDIASLVLRITASLALLAVCLLTAQLREIADKEAKNLDAIARRAVVIEQDTDDTLNDLHKSALLIPKVIHDTRLTLDNANKAAIDERIYFEQEVPGLMARVNLTVDQISSTLATYQKTGEALTAATQGLQPVEDNAALDLAQFDNLLSDPDIKAAAKNIASSTGHADAILADAQVEADKIAHPPKKKLGFWASVYAGAQVVHKLSPPLF